MSKRTLFPVLMLALAATLNTACGENLSGAGAMSSEGAVPATQNEAAQKEATQEEITLAAASVNENVPLPPGSISSTSDAELLQYIIDYYEDVLKKLKASLAQDGVIGRDGKPMNNDWVPGVIAEFSQILDTLKTDPQAAAAVVEQFKEKLEAKEQHLAEKKAFCDQLEAELKNGSHSQSALDKIKSHFEESCKK